MIDANEIATAYHLLKDCDCLLTIHRSDATGLGGTQNSRCYPKSTLFVGAKGTSRRIGCSDLDQYKVYNVVRYRYRFASFELLEVDKFADGNTRRRV